MNLDIRLPIGLLFATLGALLVLYGVVTYFSQPSLYDRSLGINVNFWWGLVMVLFGATMTWLGRHGSVARPSSSETH
jgi:hypothetical protein